MKPATHCIYLSLSGWSDLYFRFVLASVGLIGLAICIPHLHTGCTALCLSHTLPSLGDAKCWSVFWLSVQLPGQFTGPMRVGSSRHVTLCPRRPASSPGYPQTLFLVCLWPCGSLGCAQVSSSLARPASLVCSRGLTPAPATCSNTIKEERKEMESWTLKRML